MTAGRRSSRDSSVQSGSGYLRTPALLLVTAPANRGLIFHRFLNLKKYPGPYARDGVWYGRKRVAIDLAHGLRSRCCPDGPHRKILRSIHDGARGTSTATATTKRRKGRALLAATGQYLHKIAKSASDLSVERASLLKILEKTPKRSFDHLYLTRFAQVQQAETKRSIGQSWIGRDPCIGRSA